MAEDLFLSVEDRAKFTEMFRMATHDLGKPTLGKSEAGLDRSGLPLEVLLRIWSLADVDNDDQLNEQEYLMCCFLVQRCVRHKLPPPDVLPASLLQSTAQAPQTSVTTGFGDGTQVATAFQEWSSEPVNHTASSQAISGTFANEFDNISHGCSAQPANVQVSSTGCMSEVATETFTGFGEHQMSAANASCPNSFGDDFSQQQIVPEASLLSSPHCSSGQAPLDIAQDKSPNIDGQSVHASLVGTGLDRFNEGLGQPTNNAASNQAFYSSANDAKFGDPAQSSTTPDGFGFAQQMQTTSTFYQGSNSVGGQQQLPSMADSVLPSAVSTAGTTLNNVPIGFADFGQHSTLQAATSSRESPNVACSQTSYSASSWTTNNPINQNLPAGHELTQSDSRDVSSSCAGFDHKNGAIDTPQSASSSVSVAPCFSSEFDQTFGSESAPDHLVQKAPPCTSAFSTSFVDTFDTFGSNFGDEFDADSHKAVSDFAEPKSSRPDSSFNLAATQHPTASSGSIASSITSAQPDAQTLTVVDSIDALNTTGAVTCNGFAKATESEHASSLSRVPENLPGNISSAACETVSFCQGSFEGFADQFGAGFAGSTTTNTVLHAIEQDHTVLSSTNFNDSSGNKPPSAPLQTNGSQNANMTAALATLTDMGFDKSRAVAALNSSGGDLIPAIEALSRDQQRAESDVNALSHSTRDAGAVTNTASPAMATTHLAGAGWHQSESPGCAVPLSSTTCSSAENSSFHIEQGLSTQWCKSDNNGSTCMSTSPAANSFEDMSSMIKSDTQNSNQSQQPNYQSVVMHVAEAQGHMSVSSNGFSELRPVVTALETKASELIAAENGSYIGGADTVESTTVRASSGLCGPMHDVLRTAASTANVRSAEVDGTFMRSIQPAATFTNLNAAESLDVTAVQADPGKSTVAATATDENDRNTSSAAFGAPSAAPVEPTSVGIDPSQSTLPTGCVGAIADSPSAAQVKKACQINSADLHCHASMETGSSTPVLREASTSIDSRNRAHSAGCGAPLNPAAGQPRTSSWDSGQPLDSVFDSPLSSERASADAGLRHAHRMHGSMCAHSDETDRPRQIENVVADAIPQEPSAVRRHSVSAFGDVPFVPSRESHFPGPPHHASIASRSLSTETFGNTEFGAAYESPVPSASTASHASAAWSVAGINAPTASQISSYDSIFAQLAVSDVVSLRTVDNLSFELLSLAHSTCVREGKLCSSDGLSRDGFRIFAHTMIGLLTGGGDKGAALLAAVTSTSSNLQSKHVVVPSGPTLTSVPPAPQLSPSECSHHQPTKASRNPFQQASAGKSPQGSPDPSPLPWQAPTTTIDSPSEMHKQRYSQIFSVIHTKKDRAGIDKQQCHTILRKSGLPSDVLAHIWRLADVDEDGFLTREEFVLAMHLTNVRVKSGHLPAVLPNSLRPPF